MADKEITAQIDKLRKTRPARAIEAMGAQLIDANLRAELAAVLSFLRDDLREECRLLEVAKLRGGVTIIKDRTAVSGWLELFIIQLGREPDAPTERLSPSAELGEHRPSEFGEDWAVNPGPGGRCAVGNVHDASTLKCPCGYNAEAGLTHVSQHEIDEQLSSTIDYLSGASDELPDAHVEIAQLHQRVDADAAAYIGDALTPAQQAAHDAIDKELAHVTADSIVDPFAPIPIATYRPATPPGARQVTALDLLTPVDASLLPAHVSFSQLTTVADCGVKFRLQRVEQLPQVPQWANVGGKAFHRAIERIETVHAQTGAPMPSEAIVATCWDDALTVEIEETEKSSGMSREQFRASQQGKENYDWWRVEGALMLQRYVDWRRGDGSGQQVLQGPGGAPMLEWETTYDVDGVPFKTILDSVWTAAIEESRIDGPGAVIRDWKTGTMTPDDRQLCTQAWGLRKAGWQGPIVVQFFDARKGTFTTPFDPFERMSWDDVRYFVLSGDAERRLPILPARPSDFCGGCPVAYACPVNTQRRAPKPIAR